MFVKGQSGNPKGRGKGAVSACTKAKNDYFKVYQKLGGFQAFYRYMNANRSLWPDFYFKVLPGLMPKRTELDGNISATLKHELTQELQEKLDQVINHRDRT